MQLPFWESSYSSTRFQLGLNLIVVQTQNSQTDENRRKCEHNFEVNAKIASEMKKNMELGEIENPKNDLFTFTYTVSKQKTEVKLT